MSPPSRVADYLDHITRAIDRIGRYTQAIDLAAFMTSELVQDAVIRNIEVLGEASNNVLRQAPDFAARHADIPWQVMYAMRNRVSHGYEKVDLEIVWNTIQRDLPRLRAQVQQAKTDTQA